ncbi:Transposase Orf2, Tn3 family [Serratia symbiotica SCt-VLC]|uniref:Transposase Orf2, Tn3 family n=1 Tax=Serratia symbiotica SCt-VLC TaxID=1347341 RepID=A0A068RCH6_9GAMM|nr:Transposase Orf2, Tn3 family [Serratia symbiotica SCt-VLC]
MAARAPTTRLGFVVLLKTFQRLGYFVLSSQVPEPLIRHIAQSIGRNADLRNLNHYDHSEARRKHVGIIRRFLDVNPLTATGKSLLRNTFIDAALIKEDVADIINVGIEVLIRHRYELPAFDSLVRTARSARAEANQALYSRVQTAVGEEGAAFLDALFVVGDDPRRVSAWNDLKQDPARPTVYGMRDLLVRFKILTDLAGYNRALKTLPVVKISQWALEGNALDAASMADLVPARRYAITLAVIQQRLGVVKDDLCDIFCKQMNKVSRAAEAELQQYLDDNQGKTDEILRRYALLNTVLHSTESADNQLKIIRETVSSRPDLYEFSRLHIEFGGKNECRFMLKAFGQRRAELLRILSTLNFVSTSQDTSFERALALMLSQRRCRSEWITLKKGAESDLSLSDLSWVPDKWWKLITGDQQRKAPEQLSRRQFEVCVCTQMVRELKSGDLCVTGANVYSDYRDELVPLPECVETRDTYGQEVGLPLETNAFIDHVRDLLTTAAQKADDLYPDNLFFQIINGRPRLATLKKKPLPGGFKALDAAVGKKLNKLGLSLLDIMSDTTQWLHWNKHIGPLSGHKGKLKKSTRRKIITTFAYATGLGPMQTSRTIADISARQISFVDQRQVTTEKLEAATVDIINGYNKFQLPQYWGETKRAAADGTQWDLYENNLLSERHIRYGGYGGLAYYHVSDTYIALFSHFIPCGAWEAIYILDGLTQNKSDIQPEILHGDTQAQSAPVYGLAFLLGIKLMPRVRNWKDLKWFKATSDEIYQHIETLFSKETIDWALISCHLPDMLQVAQSIRAGRLSPSTILRKLGTASRKNKLYFAFRELGRVIRTLFLLEYIGDEELRRIIQAAQNKCEGFNQFTQWVHFGADKITNNVRDEQLKVIKYNHLVANLVIFHNCQTLTQALKELEAEGMILTPEILARFSPYRTHHINRFGLSEVKERHPPPANYDVKF